MRTAEETLELALEAFWAKVEELHPERAAPMSVSAERYDLELHARNAVDAWLELNTPVFYVQRTVTQVIRIEGELNPDDAEAKAADIPNSYWFEKSLDTDYEYIVLGPNGQAL